MYVWMYVCMYECGHGLLLCIQMLFAFVCMCTCIFTRTFMLISFKNTSIRTDYILLTSTEGASLMHNTIYLLCPPSSKTHLWGLIAQFQAVQKEHKNICSCMHKSIYFYSHRPQKHICEVWSHNLKQYRRSFSHNRAASSPWGHHRELSEHIPPDMSYVSVCMRESISHSWAAFLPWCDHRVPSEHIPPDMLCMCVCVYHSIHGSKHHIMTYSTPMHANIYIHNKNALRTCHTPTCAHEDHACKSKHYMISAYTPTHI